MSCNRKADFCRVDVRCRNLCQASKPSSCNQGLDFIARIYAIPFDLTGFSKQNPLTQNFSIHKHLHTPFSILNPLSLIHVLSIQILFKIAENNTKQKASQHYFKISTSMFSAIDKIFYNQHFISTDCNYTIPLQPN